MVAGDSGKLNIIKPGNGAKAASKVIFALLRASREVLKAGFEISDHYRKSTTPEDSETENKISGGKLDQSIQKLRNQPEESDSQSPSKAQTIMHFETESQKSDHTQVQAAMADSDRVHEMKGGKNKKRKFQTFLGSRGETEISDSQSPSKAQAIMHFETESQKSAMKSASISTFDIMDLGNDLGSLELTCKQDKSESLMGLGNDLFAEELMRKEGRTRKLTTTADTESVNKTSVGKSGRQCKFATKVDSEMKFQSLARKPGWQRKSAANVALVRKVVRQSKFKANVDPEKKCPPTGNF
ncbi:hypothetical protein CEXT_806091 [Caerostris extrusa]|uniref:Uncharacterized protein n=1 Tax=Caerostris extrusa TaxID=172846 RepID=A0AAV4TSZ0_CAEEX|nr:hypothetical protein CEXT_806091 [Caerostris extrusa]